jgi:glycosyltransferase involved in cell wall biosynthesis
VRVLLVSHPPLTAELGAAQVALQLAAALRARGHDARAWSPEPLPPDTRAWNLWHRQARAIERYAREAGPFDAIDTPAISASRSLARAGRLVVRSVQPELRYLGHAVARDAGRRPGPRALARALVSGRQSAAILAGWSRASVVLCLGSLELAWMRRRFPFWRAKLAAYDCAPAPGESAALAEVRLRRLAGSATTAAAARCGDACPDRADGAGGNASGGVRAPGEGGGLSGLRGAGRIDGAGGMGGRGGGVRFLWLGRWAAHKGTARLRRFLAARTVSCPADTFTLAGCGEAPARELPAEWLRAGRVRIVPRFTRAELPALLAGHDAGLFTSDVEGWGLCLNEMLESGLPVYATAAGAVADLLPYFPGALRPFPPPPQGDLPPAPPADLAANGYEARFHWDAIAAAYERLALASPAAHGPMGRTAPAAPRPPTAPGRSSGPAAPSAASYANRADHPATPAGPTAPAAPSVPAAPNQADGANRATALNGPNGPIAPSDAGRTTG